MNARDNVINCKVKDCIIFGEFSSSPALLVNITGVHYHDCCEGSMPLMLTLAIGCNIKYEIKSI